MSKTRKRQLRYQIAHKLKLLKTGHMRFITHFESKIRQLSIMQSVFNSLTPRSAGFISIPVANFMPPTLFIVMIQMWIGGASQSMAGGIKVNTLGVLLLNLRSIVTGRKGVNAFNRNIAIHSVRRANAVITLSILFTIIIS